MIPSLDEIRELLSYDPETGIFTWLQDRNQLAKKGARAGYQRHDGYWLINMRGHTVLCHRLAWLLTAGEWPSDMIDHINGDPSDNRLANLREADRSQNMMNMALPPANTSGFKGVSFDRRQRKWQAYITIQRRKKSLGYYTDLSEAAFARKVAEEKFFGSFARAIEG